jgi:putative membrane protein
MPNASWLALFAQAEVAEIDPFWTNLWHGFIGSLVFGLLGIVLIVLGFKVFDLMTPRIAIEKELAEKNNMAVAIVCAAMILGVAIIAGVAVR